MALTHAGPGLVNMIPGNQVESGAAVSPRVAPPTDPKSIPFSKERTSMNQVGFVSGHGFSRAAKAVKKTGLSAPEEFFLQTSGLLPNNNVILKRSAPGAPSARGMGQAERRIRGCFCTWGCTTFQSCRKAFKEIRAS